MNTYLPTCSVHRLLIKCPYTWHSCKEHQGHTNKGQHQCEVGTAFRLIFKQARLKGEKGKDIRFIPILLGRITSLVMPIVMSNALCSIVAPLNAAKYKKYLRTTFPTFPTYPLPSLRYLGIHNSVIISSDFMPDFLHFVSEPIPNSFVFIIIIVATVTVAVAATIPILTSAVLRGGSRL